MAWRAGAGLGERLKSRAAQNRQGRIFGKLRVGLGAAAQNKHAAAPISDRFDVAASGTQPCKFDHLQLVRCAQPQNFFLSGCKVVGDVDRVDHHPALFNHPPVIHIVVAGDDHHGI